MSSNAKTNREFGRTPKHSTLFSNVTAIVFAPVSILTEDSVNDNTNLLRSSPTELFEAFKERNNSSMRTRLNESLEEIRLAGWIDPFTLLIKGPLEELEVIKEAWRRHFLRSPADGLVIRDIGVVASVEMEVVQQSPFLPLARALYEAIAALNENDQPATQQSIVDFLFEVYQYVHVPKLNVIHGCLGILIKEDKIYHNGTGYFVSSPPPSGDKPKVSPTNETDTSPLSKEPVAPKGAKSTEENMTQQEDTREVENRCIECGGNLKRNTDGERKQSMDTQVVEPNTGRSRKKVSIGKTETDKKLSSSSKDSNLKEESKIPEFADKEKKGARKEKQRHRKDSNSNSTTSETTSSTSEQTHKKNPKDKQNQEGKKSKRNVFSQMSCLISKTFSTADVFHEEAPDTTVPSKETEPISLDAQITEDKASVVSNDTSVFDARKLSRKADYKDENEVKIADDFRDLHLSVTRSRSFVQPPKKRQDHPARSISLTTNAVRASPRIEKTTGDVARPEERRAHANQTDSAYRNVMFRRSMPPLSSSGTFPVGIVRPLTNSRTTDYRTVSRSNSTKAESSRKSSASGTPSSTPKMKDKAVGHARRSVQLKVTSKGLEGHVPFRTMENQIYHVETPLKQLPCSNAKHQTSSSSKVRETAPTKMRYFGPGPHFVPGNVQEKAAARSTVPFQECESTHAPSTSAVYYDNNCKLSGKNIEQCYFHGAELNTAHEQMSGLVDSQDICLEEVSSSDGSDLYHVAGERYLEGKPFPPRQFVDGESKFDESLTFIGII